MKAYEKNRIPHVIFGSGSAETVGQQFRKYGAEKVLIVTDKGIVNLGIAGRIVKYLEAEGIISDIYDSVLPDPADTFCLEVRRIIQENGYDGVLGLGGGSSMDVAKVGCLLAGIEEEITELHDYSMTGSKMKPSYRRPAVLITMPTTSGTGAECTMTGVISSTSLGLKYSIGNENLIADLAIIDPLLTVGMPARPTIYCGIDILAHSMECILGPGHNDYTNVMMLECIERAWKWLPIAVKEPENIEAREQLSWAAHNALCNGGMSNGHAVAHAIGTLYHLVHGHACAVVLPTVFRHFCQWEENDEIIREIAKRIGVPTTKDPIENGNRVADAIVEYYKKLGLKPLKAAKADNGFHDEREAFIKKAIPVTMDDFKSHLWMPPIHTDNYEDKVGKVLGMIYDEE